MNALRYCLTVTGTTLVTTWALAQPPTTEDLQARHQAGLGILLTVIIGLAVILILLRLLAGRERREHEEHPEDTP